MRPRPAPRSVLRPALPAALVLAAVAAAPRHAAAQLVADPLGDYLSGYAGPRNGDLDVIGANVFYDGSAFRFVSRSAAAIGTTPGAVFVWGIDRGQGTARFGTLAPGVLFDAVVSVTPGTTPGTATATVTRIVGGGSTVLPVGAISIVGADLSVLVPVDLLPSLGFAPSAYTANLWPRVGTGNNNQISDFAPDNSNLAVVATPEPGAGALLAAGLGLAAAAARRRRGA